MLDEKKKSKFFLPVIINKGRKRFGVGGGNYTLLNRKVGLIKERGVGTRDWHL